MNLDKALEKGWENKSLDELLDDRPSDLTGLTERHDELLRELGIRTQRDLETKRHFPLADALVALANKVG